MKIFKQKTPQLSNEDLFDRIVKDKGGRFAIEDIDIQSQLLFFELKERAQTVINEIPYKFYGAGLNISHTMPPVHFDFINSPLFNAGAFSVDGVEFIGVNYGTVLIILDMFNRMMARQDIMPEIGNPLGEINPEPIKLFTQNYEQMQIEYDSWDYDSIILPRDPVRSEHASLLTSIAIEFLIQHEYAHLKNGHLEFGKMVTGRSFMMEFEKNDYIKLPSLTSRTLEWNADNWASGMSVFTLTDFMANSLYADRFINYENYASGLCLTSGFAIWCLFRLMHQFTGGHQQTDESTHPSASQRQFYTYFRAVATVRRNIKIFGVNFFGANFGKVAYQSENAFALVSGESVDLQDLKQLFTDVVNLQKKPLNEQTFDFQKELEKHWHEILEPKLKLLSRGELTI